MTETRTSPDAAVNGAGSCKVSDSIFVSVVIPARNSLPDLEDQLDSLVKQTYAGPYEVIVADNGSNDGLADRLEQYVGRDILNLRRVDASSEVGASYARNTGAALARGEFLAFCDADDLVHPEWIESLIGSASEYDIVGTAIETESVNSARALDWTPTASPESQGKTAFLPFAIGASIGCWKSVYQDLGGMSCELVASEDVEFCWRAQLSGYKLGFLPRQLVAYRLRDSLMPLIKQSYNLGYGFAQLQGAYRSKGCPPVQIRAAMRWWVLLALGNPLVPRFITRISRGQWLRAVAAHVGEFRGGLKYRTFVW